MATNRQFPRDGQTWARVRDTMLAARAQDLPWRAPRIFKPAYYAGEDLVEVANAAYQMYVSDNALYGNSAFPSIGRRVGLGGHEPSGPLGLRGSRANPVGHSRRLFAGIRAAGLEIIGKPDAYNFAFTGTGLDMHAVADALEAKGWTVRRANEPSFIQLMVNRAHDESAEDFGRDLKAAVDDVRAGRVRERCQVRLRGVRAT